MKTMREAAAKISEQRLSTVLGAIPTLWQVRQPKPRIRTWMLRVITGDQ